MPKTGHIDYVELPSRDLEATKRFFADAFGWSFVDFGPDYAVIENAGLNGGFFASDRAATTEDGSVLVVLYAADLADARARVEAAGGRVVRDVFSFPGGRRFHFADPSGNEYAVWTEADA